MNVEVSKVLIGKLVLEIYSYGYMSKFIKSFQLRKGNFLGINFVQVEVIGEDLRGRRR